MTALDIDATLRWYRFDPRKRLVRRHDDDLPFVGDSVGVGQGLLLDTCVYIDQLTARMPSKVGALIERRQVNHSTVAIQELLFSIGALDPRDGRAAGTIAEIAALVRSMRPHRVFAPDPDLLGRAAVLAGLLCRTQDYQGDSRKRAMMDAALFLQGQKLGLVVLTRNIGDFDLMLQLLPSGRAQFYRTGE